MGRLVREIQDLCEAVFHVEHPDHDAQNAQYAWLPGASQSHRIRHGLFLPRGQRPVWAPCSPGSDSRSAHEDVIGYGSATGVIAPTSPSVSPLGPAVT